MTYRLLDQIQSPQDIKGLSHQELAILAEDIRADIIAACSQGGGHLAPSLGAVEIILAAHRRLDCPRDKIVFDVGHQAYAHKLITGRSDRFYTLRAFEGLSGFPKVKESPYDAHDSGHASDSLATALGYAIARDLDGDDYKILTVIGDAAMSGGMALEALNQIGSLQKRMIIILNDNEMSISPSVGAFSNSLARIRSDRRYRMAHDKVREMLASAPAILEDKPAHLGSKIKDAIKQFVLPGMFFEEWGITYFGPVNGHDIALLEDTIDHALLMDGPVLIHAVTQKGKGFEPAERNPQKFHGVGPFDPKTGEVHAKPSAAPAYTKVFAGALIDKATQDADIVAITAAMPSGTGLDAFEQAFPDRFLDVGIAEECAVTTASGLALAGKKPVVAIYSTFLQRAFDQIVTNVCLEDLPVIFAVDRAGLVGEDGPTHHGIFDMAYLRCMPGMHILAPSNERELVGALHTALALHAPVALRFPRGSGEGVSLDDEVSCFELGKAGSSTHGDNVQILAVGRMVGVARDAAALLSQDGLSVGVTDMRWVKPLDVEAVRSATQARLIVTLEEGTTRGGFGSAVLETLAAQCEERPPVLTIGIDDCYVEQGSVSQLLSSVGLDAASVAHRIAQRCKELDLRGDLT